MAFRQRERYDTRHPDARPWLYGIATDLLRREQRAEVRQYRALARTGVDPASEQVEEEVVARVVASAAHRRLAAVLAKLPAGERNVLLLVAWEQLSYDEVARALGVPVGTVRSRLHSARKRVRAVMGDLDPSSCGDEEMIMDELDFVRGFRSEVSPADPAMLTAARAELHPQMPGGIVGAEYRRPVTGLRWSLAATGGLAVALVGVLAVGGINGNKPQAGNKPPASTEVPGTEAGQVLQLATFATQQAIPRCYYDLLVPVGLAMPSTSPVMTPKRLRIDLGADLRRKPTAAVSPRGLECLVRVQGRVGVRGNHRHDRVDSGVDGSGNPLDAAAVRSADDADQRIGSVRVSLGRTLSRAAETQSMMADTSRPSKFGESSWNVPPEAN